jgi:hypothetical protein
MNQSFAPAPAPEVSLLIRQHYQNLLMQQQQMMQSAAAPVSAAQPHATVPDALYALAGVMTPKQNENKACLYKQPATKFSFSLNTYAFRRIILRSLRLLTRPTLFVP